MAAGPFVGDGGDVILSVRGNADVRAANIHRNEGAHADYYTGGVQRRQWLVRREQSSKN